MHAKRIAVALLLGSCCPAFAIDGQELADRLAGALDFDDVESQYRLTEHQPITFTVELDKKQAKVYFDNNLMFEMTATVKDLTTPKISIADNLIELSSAGQTSKLIINKAGKVMRVRRGDGKETPFGRVSIKSQSRGRVLTITLEEGHAAIRFSISQKLKASFAFTGSTVFEFRGKDVSLQGQPRKSLLEFTGAGGHRKIRFNRSRQTLYFPTAPASRQVFAKLESLAPEIEATTEFRKAFNDAKKEFMSTDYFCDGTVRYVDKSDGGPHWIWKRKVNYKTTETKLTKDEAQYITKCIQRNDRLEKLLKKIRAAAGEGIGYELEKIKKSSN